jgi:ATP-dependent DNA helicase RecG
MNQKLIPSINRIIIGDVGSGKTIVGFLIGLVFLKGLSFGEVAMVAPTEVLAFQHYQKLLELIQNIPKIYQFETDSKSKIENITLIYLAGNSSYINGQKYTKTKFGKELERIQNTSSLTDHKFFWVGTHALLFNDLICPDLIMVDEQHRFGVRQREKLTKKQTDIVPHFLSFTATPIPRTLALTVFGGLQPHFIDTLKSRNPIQTSICSFDKMESILFPKIQSVLDQDRKIYIICPAVEESKSDDKDQKKLWSVQKTVEIMEQKFGSTVINVHGKLKEKKEILDEFKSSKTKNILVATTVIEVGVDVAAASLVIILNAERFGLSALHQIRGRVGRNTFADNFCILVTEPEMMFSRRLKYICQYQSGFELAEKDLEIRGSGDMIGSMQSGFGNEIDSLIGLNPKLYEQIKDLVYNLDFESFEPQLPRLKAYLEKEKDRVWEE